MKNSFFNLVFCLIPGLSWLGCTTVVEKNTNQVAADGHAAARKMATAADCPASADIYLQPGITINNDPLVGKSKLVASCQPVDGTTYPPVLCVYTGNAGGELILGYHSLPSPPTDGVLMIYADGFAPTDMTLSQSGSTIIGQKFSVGGDSGASTHGKDVVQYDSVANTFATRSYSKNGFFSGWTENTSLDTNYSCTSGQ